ncbi:PR domain zinc finger protein 1 [Trichonephila clavipes]|nr:PR domain zinc finger protein 1 [Trichonephila clavipes]
MMEAGWSARTGSGCSWQISRREDHYIIRNTHVQPTASFAAIQAQNQVVFRDESRFSHSTVDNRVRVWRPHGEHLNPAFALQQHNHSHSWCDVEDFLFKKGSCRLHYCTVCNYSSPLLANLKRHLLTHTGERPFSCSVCGKGFIEKRGLTAHLLNHSGERPHKCNVCAKGFVRKSDVRAHMVVHLLK